MLLFLFNRLSPKSLSNSMHSPLLTVRQHPESLFTLSQQNTEQVHFVQSLIEARCKRAIIAASLCYENIVEEALLCAALLPSSGGIRADSKLTALTSPSILCSNSNMFDAIINVLACMGVTLSESQRILLERLILFFHRVSNVVHDAVMQNAKNDVLLWNDGIGTYRPSADQNIEINMNDTSYSSPVTYNDVSVQCGVCGQHYPAIFMCQSSTSPATFRHSDGSPQLNTSFRFSPSTPASRADPSLEYIFCQRCQNQIFLHSPNDRSAKKTISSLQSETGCIATKYSAMLSNALFVLDMLTVDVHYDSAKQQETELTEACHPPVLSYLEVRGIAESSNRSLPFSRSSSLGDSLSDSTSQIKVSN